MRKFDEGHYWVQVAEDDDPEVALYSGGGWLLHATEETFETTDFYRIGRRVELGQDAFEPAVFPDSTT